MPASKPGDTDATILGILNDELAHVFELKQAMESIK